jgi:molecular chaperone GrpE
MNEEQSQKPADPENVPFEDPAEVARQRDEYLDLVRRTQAEFVNYQKRSKAQAEADRQYAVGNLALDLLNVMDNLDRAVEAARQAGSSSIVEGLELVQRQFLQALAKHGVQPIEAVGLAFDPNQHEALTRFPSADHPEGTVVQELARGYKIHDRVLRPARVAVSSAP